MTDDSVVRGDGSDGWPATDDPEFYCHGQKCIDEGCTPLSCHDAEYENLGDGEA